MPTWLARLGQSIAGDLAGFVNRGELNELVHHHGLTVVDEAMSLAGYEAVWRTAAATP